MNMKNKKTLGFLFVTSLTFISCNSGSFASSGKTKNPEELMTELKMQEKKYPLIYLKVDAEMTENRIKIKDAGVLQSEEYVTDGSTIYGTIKNTATMAEFKDLVVTLTYYSNTGSEIESKDYPINDFFGPKSVDKFKLKVYPPESMAKFGIEIKNARAVD